MNLLWVVAGNSQLSSLAGTVVAHNIDKTNCKKVLINLNELKCDWWFGFVVSGDQEDKLLKYLPWLVMVWLEVHL